MKLTEISVWLLLEQKPQAVDIRLSESSRKQFRVKLFYDVMCLLCLRVVHFRKRDKAERRAPHRKWPLPANQGPLWRGASRTQRTVTLPCVISIFLMCACMYTLLMIALLSNLDRNNVITMY